MLSLCPTCGYKTTLSICPLCRTRLEHSQSNPKHVAYWLIFRRAPWSTEWVREPVHRNFVRAEARRRFYEMRGYETRPVMPVFLNRNPKPLTWEYIAGFVDGEAHISATVRDRRLITYFEIYQRNHERGAIELLENIRSFLLHELGVEGVIYERAPNDYVLYYRRDIDVYKLCHAFLPHLHLKHRIEQAKNTIRIIEEYVTTQIDRMRKEVETGRDLVLRAHLKEYQEWLKEMENIKKRYPLTLT